MTTATARKEWLDAQADEGLKEVAEAKARAKLLEENARSDERKRHELNQRRKVLEGKRLDAIRRAERTWEMFLEALGEIHELAGVEAKLRGDLGMGAAGLAPIPLAKRLTSYMCENMRRLPGGTLGCYGTLKLVGSLPRGAKNWIEAEKFTTKPADKEPEKRAVDAEIDTAKESK